MIDAINRALKLYGFTGFEIVPAKDAENQYSISRQDGTSAINTLSEGKETFLTFLYFMQQTKGDVDQSKISDKKIIVLDDPISSLDSTILYVVGAMVKDLAKKIIANKGDVTQLFVLTHNVFFHKEAAFDPRNKMGKNARFWIVRKNEGISSIQDYGNKTPISTSYELLWQDLKDNANSSLIATQNNMRRIIENYFKLLGNQRNEQIEEHFEIAEEKMICRSLLYWGDDGSHSIPDDLHIDSYTDAVPKYKEIFRKIFDLSGNISHYNMMMGIEENSV